MFSKLVWETRVPFFSSNFFHHMHEEHFMSARVLCEVNFRLFDTKVCTERFPRYFL